MKFLTDSFPILSNETTISAVALLIRLVIGMAFFLHGAQKVFGWFGGPGLDKWSQYLSTQGYSKTVSVFSAYVEMIAGFLLIIGVFTKISAISMIVFMLFAIGIAHWDKGYFSQKGGYEYQLLLIVSCIIVLLLGGGEYSVDKYLFD
jgi:putative oxidoreductase